MAQATVRGDAPCTPPVPTLLSAAPGDTEVTLGWSDESADTGVTGGIHVSEAAYRSLRKIFVFKVRGSYFLKNIGEISTYLLTGRI